MQTDNNDFCILRKGETDISEDQIPLIEKMIKNLDKLPMYNTYKTQSANLEDYDYFSYQFIPLINILGIL